MSNLRSLALFALLCAPLAAQQYYHPAPGWLAELHATDSQAMKKALEGTAVGRLLQSPEIAPVVEKFLASFHEREQRIDQLKAMAKAAGVAADPFEELGATLRDKGYDSDLRNLRAWLWLHETTHEPTVVVSVSAGTEESKLLRSSWQSATRTLCDKKVLVAASGAPELSGHKFELFKHEGESPFQVWFWSHDDQHVLGIGDQLLPGSFAKEPAPLPAGIARLLGERPGVALSVAIDRALALGTKQDERSRKIAAALGLDGITSLTMGLAVDGGHLRESLFAETSKGQKGLLAAWVEAKAPLPSHPQVPDGLVQIGLSLDPARIRAAVTGIAAAAGIEPDANVLEVVSELQKALTGGFSFQVSGPRGSLVPRLSLAAGIADRSALDALLARARSELHGVEFDDRETEGVPWTSVKVPDNPSPMVPTYAVLGDSFVIAESPATIKAMIKAMQEKAATAMSTEGAPAVAAAGEVRPALDVRYDAGALWRVLQKNYLSIVQLGIGQMMMATGMRGEPLLAAGELPEASAIAPHLGLGRGGLAVDKDGGILLTCASSLGDPLTAALAAIMVPMLPQSFGIGLDGEAGRLQGQIGEARLKKVHQALCTWRASFGGGKSLPRNLGELFSRGLLDGDDALAVPGATETLKIEYEDADGAVKKVASSFRYVPDGKLKTTKAKLDRYRASGSQPFIFTRWDDDKPATEEVAIVLYEHKEHPRGQRLLMTADGAVHQISEQGAAELLGGK